MRIDSMIRIIDNKEYKTVEYDELGALKWYDVKLDDGGMIRIEKCLDQMMALYITPGKKVADDVWIGKNGTNAYYILNNIYNELDK